MAALVTLAQAKDNMGVTYTHRDAEIHQKCEEATAIILDYLKNRSVAIASISAANPAVVTTSTPHSLVSGTTYTLAGTTTTPTVNGARVITVTGPTTFTVPVTVTVGQTSAAGTVGSPGWTPETVPLQIRRAILVMVTHLFEHPGDDMSADDTVWAAIERLLMRSRDPALA